MVEPGNPVKGAKKHHLYVLSKMKGFDKYLFESAIYNWGALHGNLTG